MKKYVLIALCIGLSLQAERNPFNLKENLEKIDQNQNVLLSALKEISGKKEVVAPDIVDANESDNRDKSNKELQPVQNVEVKDNTTSMKSALDIKAKEQKKSAAKNEKHETDVKKIVLEKKGEDEIQHEGVANINIKEEHKIERKEADSAYLKAIAEVDAEN